MAKKRNRYDEIWNQNRGRKKGNNRKESLWDLERDGITFSMLSKFLTCRERFRLSAVEGWTPKNIRVPLEFGSAFHKCMEHVEGGGRIEQIGEVVDQYQYSRKKEHNLTADDMTDLERVMAMVETTYFAYHDYWSRVPTFRSESRRYFDHSLKYVYQEEAFDVMHSLPSGRKIRLRGRWDAVFKHPISKKLVLQENKTKSTIDEYGIHEGLKKDLQTQFYLWSLYLAEGVFPRHVLYNVIRRSGLRPSVKETVAEFRKRVSDDIEKRPEHYFMRWIVDVDIEDLTLFRDRMLNPLLETVARWWDSIKHDPFDPWTLEDGSPNYLHYEKPFGIFDSAAFGGKGDYWDLLYLNRYDNYFQRTVPFPELEEE